MLTITRAFPQHSDPVGPFQWQLFDAQRKLSTSWMWGGLHTQWDSNVWQKWVKCGCPSGIVGGLPILTSNTKDHYRSIRRFHSSTCSHFFRAEHQRTPNPLPLSSALDSLKVLSVFVPPLVWKWIPFVVFLNLRKCHIINEDGIRYQKNLHTVCLTDLNSMSLGSFIMSPRLKEDVMM